MEIKEDKIKILIIRIGAIGDVVHTTNTYRSIKRAYPNSQIHYLTSKLIAPLLINDPDLDKVMTIDKNSMGLFTKYTLDFAKQLKEEKYNIIINLQPSLKLKWLAFLSQAYKVVNYKKTFKMHAVDNFWDTAQKVLPDIKHLSNLEVYLSHEIRLKMQEQTKDFKRPLMILNAGGVFAKRQGRTYPIEKWIELGNKLQDKYNGTIILTGVKEDSDVLKPLETIKNAISFIDKLTLEENTALISCADLMISGDSGPLHLATALKTKAIGLYGSMPVERTGTFGNGNISIKSKKKCVPCNRRKCKYLKHSKNLFAPCMEQISQDEIIEKIDLEGY